jgi:hypothetical protein
LTFKYATQTIASQTALRPLAKKLKVSYGSLLDLNPELQRGVTPPGKHTIRIPAELVEKRGSEATAKTEEDSTVP